MAEVVTNRETKTNRILTGRKVVYSDSAYIDASNVVDELDKAICKQSTNEMDIRYLYNYYLGNQPIMNRTKTFNDHVLNKVVVNRANEIVTFKTGYLIGEPIQYTARKSEDAVSNAIAKLNDYCYSEGKDTKDVQLVDWFNICGTSYRMVIPDRRGEEDDSPFEIHTLDPRNTFVVYYSGLGHKPLMGVTYIERENGEKLYCVYTADRYFEILSGAIVREEAHYIGDIPIIEYPANESRMGCFETVITLLDAINELESDRIDAVDQFVQAIMVFKGVDVEAEIVESLKHLKALQLPENADVDYLTAELNQTQTQTLADALYDYVLEICGVPSQSNGNTSDSSNNGAVIVRQGWQHAESRAKDSERMFKMSESKFLKIALKICSEIGDISLKLGDIDITFTRRFYENNLQKVQALVSMLSSNKIHPRLAFVQSGLFVDPEQAYRESIGYFKEQEKKAQELMKVSQSDGNTDDKGKEDGKEDTKELPD